MLSGEGNATVKNNNRSNQEKSNFARAAHIFCTFLCRCFPRLQRETSRNFLVTRFMQGMSYVLSFIFFFTAAHFHLSWWPLAFLIFSPPLQNFHGVLPTKKCLLRFLLSLQISILSHFFLDDLRWSAAYFLFFSVFLFLYIPNLRA